MQVAHGLDGPPGGGFLYIDVNSKSVSPPGGDSRTTDVKVKEERKKRETERGR